MRRPLESHDRPIAGMSKPNLTFMALCCGKMVPIYGASANKCSIVLLPGPTWHSIRKPDMDVEAHCKPDMDVEAPCQFGHVHFSCIHVPLGSMWRQSQRGWDLTILTWRFALLAIAGCSPHSTVKKMGTITATCKKIIRQCIRMLLQCSPCQSGTNGPSKLGWLGFTGGHQKQT